MNFSKSNFSESNVKVVTVTKISNNDNKGTDFYNYYRAAIYEFRGDPLIAYFMEDLGIGSYHYFDICRRARTFAKDLDLLFVPGIEVMDSVDKVYRHALKV